MELEQRFADDAACREYLSVLRWPEGFVCPSCGDRKAWRMSRGLWLCGACRRQVSVTAGTIFQDAHKPLTLWFRAIWLVTSQKHGASALGMQRVLGLGSYKSAWAMLHKLRRAMVRPGRERLKGRIEVDETYWGAEEEGAVGRRTEEKTLVIVAAEEDGPGIGRIRMGRLPDLSKTAVEGFVRRSLTPGSVLVTDGWPSYAGLAGYGHAPRVVAGSGKPASELLPRVHRVVSLWKRWLLGTHQGAVQPDHLDYYLDEFTFRFNRRRSASRGKLFYRLVQQAMQVEPHPFDTLLHPKGLGAVESSQ